jgi:lysine 2,3-aminomutase
VTCDSPPELGRRDLVARFRARLTPELAKLARQHPAIARQFVPDLRELVEFGGTPEPFEEGKLTRGIYGLERVYEDRAVITPYFDCSAYCRYCFKKTRTLAGDGRRMSEEDIEKAARYIESDARIRIVLISGGDPLIDVPLLKRVLERIVRIPHVTAIRIGTRNILFRPAALTDEIASLLAGYNRVDFGDLRQSKSLALGFSLNHPAEITPDVARAVRRLVTRGVIVRGQVTLLREVNDNVQTLLDLYHMFAAVGIVPYYLYHCMPVVGAGHFRTTVQRGLDILNEMARFTGAYAPTYVYVTPVGKHRLAPHQPLEYVERHGKRHIRATTPYRARDFLEFTGKCVLPANHEVDANGFIVSHYLDGA